MNFKLVFPLVLLAPKTIFLYMGDGKSNLKYAFGLGSSTFSHEQNKNTRGKTNLKFI